MGKSLDCVVVGAGFSGCVSARLMAEAGANVLVVEKSSQIGGHCHDRQNRYGITVQTHGPHIFHTNDAEVWNLVSRFTAFRSYEHRVLSLVEGKLLPFPINIDTLQAVFGPLSGPAAARALLRAEVEKSRFRSPAVTFRDAVVAQVGEELYRLFFENYTRKQWGRDPEEILAEVARRIPVREDRESRYFTDRWQGIPVQGYTALMERMLAHPGIEVRLRHDWFEQCEGMSPALTVYTGELDRLLGHRLGTLPYRSLRFLWRTFRRDNFQPVAVVNYPNDNAYTRIIEHKHFLGESAPWTTISYEYPSKQGPPYYVVPTPESQLMRTRYLEAAARMPGRLLLTGRLAEYKYYDMDQAIRAAMDKVQSFLSGHGPTLP